MDWIFYSLVASLSVGLSMALYKMPSFKGYSSLHSTFWTNVFTLLFAVVAFFSFSNTGTLFVVSWYGLLWGVLFALTMAQQKVLLKRMETSTLLPVTSALGNVLTVIMGIVLFSDKVSLMQYAAFALILFVAFLYSRKRGGLILDAHSISLGLGIIVAGTLTKVVQKVATTHDTFFHFALYQYLGASLCALVLVYIFERTTISQLFQIQKTWRVAMLNSFFIIIAGFAFFTALSTGPLSGVFVIGTSSLVVSTALGVILYKEKLSTYKICLMILTMIGIIMIKLG